VCHQYGPTIGVAEIVPCHTNMSPTSQPGCTTSLALHFINKALRLFYLWRTFLYHATKLSSKIEKLILFVKKNKSKEKK
jgi:hypothetical protein